MQEEIYSVQDVSDLDIDFYCQELKSINKEIKSNCPEIEGIDETEEE